MDDMLPHIEELEAYEEGRLEDAEKARFEERLANDQELREELELYRKVRQGLKNDAEEDIGKDDERTLRHMMESYDRENPLEKGIGHQRKRIRRFPYLFYAAAAAVILVLILFLWWGESGNRGRMIAERHYPRDPGLPVLMSDEGHWMDRVMNLYKQKKNALALEKIRELEKEHADNDTLSYYKGVVAYESGKDSLALKAFKRTLQTPSEAFEKQAEFRLAFIYLRNGKTDKAHRRFRAIRTADMHPFRKKAGSILKDMRKASLIPAENQQKDQ